MSSESSAVLEFPVKLSASISGEVDELIAKLQEAKGLVSEVSETAPASTTEDSEETVTEHEAAEKLEEFLKTTDREGLRTLSQFAKQPNVAVEGVLLRILGKAGIYGAIAVAIIALVASAPELIKAVTEALAVKGGPLNQDFHLFFDEQQQLGLERDLQFRYATGLDVIITNYQRGYLLTDPGFVGNNLVDIDISRSFRLTTPDTQYGYVRSM